MACRDIRDIPKQWNLISVTATTIKVTPKEIQPLFFKTFNIHLAISYPFQNELTILLLMVIFSWLHNLVKTYVATLMPHQSL